MEPIEEEGTLTRGERNRSMKYSTADGMAYSLMTGLGDAYIPAAAISLGATNFYIGLLAALPQLFGAFLQFFSLSILRFFKDRKLIVVAGAFVQAVCWLCVAAVMLWPGPLSIELIAVFFTLGTGCSLLINPAWSSWISDIVPENERAGFFAGRNRLMQLMLFAATFTAGIVLNQLQLAYPAAVAFGIIFVVAATARFASTFFLTQMSNIKYEIQLMREIQLKHLFMLPAHRHELWFLAFVALLTFSVQFASPFFTPYMLNELHFTLEALGIVTATSVLAKILSYPYWGKIIDRFGNRTVLIAAAFLSPLGSVLWLFSKDLPMLLLFNIVSGFIWSGYEIAVFNYALSMVGRELRPSFISKYNIFVNVFYAAGAIAGGLFLMGFGNAMLFGFSGFLLVFLISGIMRIVVALAFTPKLTSGREVLNTSQERAMVFDLVAVYPTQGAVSHVLTGWNFTRKAVSSTTERGGRIMKEGLGATGELLVEGGRKLMSKVSRRKHL
ncbi:Major Facilitator Superfamily protein [uncultured archaeon]|nr:Major Facilitator Superfamily protein [uncultured archaeon]